MPPLQSENILASIKTFNDAELARRRDYYAYLSADEPQTESFEQHLERHADLVRTGNVASAGEIDELAARIAMPVPDELQAFYRTIGCLHCRTAHLFALSDLLGGFRGIATAYGVAKSVGIVDMIRLRWGNDRFEFDPAEGYITRSEIDALNAAYICIGWYMPEDEESAQYIYFDQHGNFGALFYHQDAFDELYQDDLLPMLTASPANQTLSVIILDAMRAAAKLYSDDDDEDDGE